MSQAVMPANCSSFVMSSNVNSLANAIGQKLPGSVNIGHPSSNSHVLNNSANSNASNGSHAYIGSSSNIGGGSTKQVDLQKLNTHKAEYRQPKSNGGRSHEDSAQSSVPNKGSKYTKDLMMSDNLQQLPAIKDQIEDIFNQQAVEGNQMAVENCAALGPQPSQMLPDLGGMNQHQRFDIIQVLQNVILELQTEIDKNKDDGAMYELLAQGPRGVRQNPAEDGQLPQDALADPQGQPATGKSPEAADMHAKNGPSPTCQQNPNASNQNQMLADPLQKISQLTKVPVNAILEMFSNITAFPVLNEQALPPNGGHLPTRQLQPDVQNEHHMAAPPVPMSADPNNIYLENKNCNEQAPPADHLPATSGWLQQVGQRTDGMVDQAENVERPMQPGELEAPGDEQRPV